MDIATESFTPGMSALGGALIGLSASLLMLSHGRIAGISGIVGGLLEPGSKDRDWRLAFVLGLVAGGIALFFAYPGAFVVNIERGSLAVVAAGLLVGFGARLGSGCTSGHGVCGISRFSRRSLVATGTFMATGAITTFLYTTLVGGAS
ncbi:MAG: YeeE/YedE family protein [Polyangiaceae bacterium]